MRLKSIVQFMVTMAFAVGLFVLGVWLIPYLMMLLWNDVTPRFGVDIQFTWWGMAKLILLVGGIRWMLTGDYGQALGFLKIKR